MGNMKHGERIYLSTLTPPTPSHNPYIVAWCTTLKGNVAVLWAKLRNVTLSCILLLCSVLIFSNISKFSPFILPYSL